MQELPQKRHPTPSVLVRVRTFISAVGSLLYFLCFYGLHAIKRQKTDGFRLIPPKKKPQFRRSHATTWLFAAVLLLLTTSACRPLYDYVGGHFRLPPETMATHVGKTALELIRKAAKSLEKTGVYDYHVHILPRFVADSPGKAPPSALDAFCNFEVDIRSSVSKNRFGFSLSKLWFYTRILESATRIDHPERGDLESAQRLLALVHHFNHYLPGTFHILAMDGVYDDNGLLDPATDLYITNRFVYQLAACLNHHIPGRDPFVPVFSINPKRKDWRAEFAQVTAWAKPGQRFIKWLPNAMGFDPQNPDFLPFYQAMAQKGFTLLTHSGHESTVEGDKQHQKFGNPQGFIPALDAGVRVVLAHSGRDGTNIDRFDGRRKSNFQLFRNMMGMAKYRGRLYGDISALTLPNTLQHLPLILDDPNLCGRMLYGSDYPLPAVSLFNPTGKLVRLGWISPEEEQALDKIYRYNPLLFDFVLKRTIRPIKGSRQTFPAALFTALDEMEKQSRGQCDNP